MTHFQAVLLFTSLSTFDGVKKKKKVKKLNYFEVGFVFKTVSFSF